MYALQLEKGAESILIQKDGKMIQVLQLEMPARPIDVRGKFVLKSVSDIETQWMKKLDNAGGVPLVGFILDDAGMVGEDYQSTWPESTNL